MFKPMVTIIPRIILLIIMFNTTECSSRWASDIIMKCCYFVSCYKNFTCAVIITNVSLSQGVLELLLKMATIYMKNTKLLLKSESLCFPFTHLSILPLIHLSTYPSLDSSIYPFIDPSIYLPLIYLSFLSLIYLSFHWYIYPSLDSSIYPSIDPSIYPSFDSSIYPSFDSSIYMYPSIRTSILPLIHLSIILFIHNMYNSIY